jgi:Kef-type K+ transport system membrane component KefB
MLFRLHETKVYIFGLANRASVLRGGCKEDDVTGWFDAVRSHILALPALAKFAVVIAIIVGVPRLAALARLPAMVGLLIFGIVLGPHVLSFLGEQRPVAEFFAELGKLLLMFSAGLEIDLALFRQVQTRSVIFGTVTTGVPLLFGTFLGLGFGYALIPAIVVGSLLASHTLLSIPIVSRLGVMRQEPVVVTIGATVISDTLSLIVFAVCLSIYTTGFSPVALAIQVIEIAVFVWLILFGVNRAGAWMVHRLGHDEEAHFLLMLGVMAVAGAIANLINLPGIVGAFLAGLAVNGAMQESPAKAKLDFFGKALFIPSFFIVTGTLIDPVDFAVSIIIHFPLALGIVVALLAGKWVAAASVGRTFGYSPAARATVWALTLPQVAATLAAAIVAYHTRSPAGQRMLDATMLNAVLVLMVATSILGPILTERFAARMLASVTTPEPAARSVASEG